MTNLVSIKSGEVQGDVNLPLSGQKFTRLRMVPGMSGELLWRKLYSDAAGAKPSLYAATGLGISYLRDNTGSFLASDHVIADLFNRYLLRGDRSPTPTQQPRNRWEMHHCLLYRVYADDSSEVGLSPSLPTGGHSGADGGGHSGADGGDCDGPNYGEALSKLPGGIVWKGQQAYALQYPGYGLLIADSNSNAIDQILHNSPDYVAPVVIGPGADFEDLLWRKYCAKYCPQGVGAEAPTADFLAIDLMKPKGIPPLTVSLKNGTLQGTAFFKRSFFSTDRIQFRIARDGSLIHNDGTSEPYIGIFKIGVGGEVYDVDVRSLFFADPNMYEMPDEPYYAGGHLKQPEGDSGPGPISDLYRHGPILKITRESTGQFVYFQVNGGRW